MFNQLSKIALIVAIGFSSAAYAQQKPKVQQKPKTQQKPAVTKVHENPAAKNKPKATELELDTGKKLFRIKGKEALATEVKKFLRGSNAFVIAEQFGMNLKLAKVQNLLYGINYLDPSPDSALGEFIAKTKAPTVVRQFYRAPEYSIKPPHELGPKRLIVGVTQENFETFKQMFVAKNFLFLLNEHGNLASFKGMRSTGTWSGQVMDSSYAFPGYGKIATMMIMSTAEGKRAEDYFELAKNYSLTNYMRRPWTLPAKDGVGAYSASSAYGTGCGTWISNMPIGDELVDEYYFSSGDDGANPNHQKLKDYQLPGGLDAQTELRFRNLWTVPGHKQLGEILDPGANRRGEFENAGFTSLSFIASAPAERVPVAFLFLQNGTTEIKEDFGLPFEPAE